VNIEKINDFWVPSEDVHRQKWIDGARLMQNKCILRFLNYCDVKKIKFRTVLDIGAWCGTWSKLVQPYANIIIAFEPDPLHFHCLQKNNIENCHPIRQAVGNETKNVALTNNNFTQKKRVSGDGDIEMVRIDDCNFQDVDFIKIDVEGYELEVLKGAKDTLKNTDYVMIELNGNTEKYGSSNKECINFIKDQGFKMVMKVWPDKIFKRIK